MAKRQQKSALRGPQPSPWRIPPPVEWAVRHGLAITLLAAVAAHLIHWLCVRAFDPFYAQVFKGWDQYTYWKWGQAIAAGDWWSAGFTSNGAFYYGPLYPYFLAAVFRIFGVSFDAAHVAQGVLGLTTPPLLWLMSRRLFGAGAALATGLLTAFCAPLLFYEQVLLMESLLAALSALLLWMSARGQDSPRLRWLWALGAGATLGVSCLGRGNFLLAAPALAAAWAAAAILAADGRNGRGERGPGARRRRWISGVALAAVFCAGMGGPLGLSLARNWQVSRGWVLLTTNGPVNFYIGNASDSAGIYSPPPSFVRLEQKHGSISRVPWKDELRASVLGDVGGWLRLMLRKKWMFWNSYDVPDNVSFHLSVRHSPLARWSPSNWLSLVPLAALGAWATRRKWRRQLPLYAFLAAYSLSIILVFISGRYRVPALIPMLAWAGAGTAWILETAWGRRWRRLAGQAGALAAGVFVLWPSWSPGVALNGPPGDPGRRYARINDYTTHARALSGIGRNAEAARMLEEGFEAHPYAASIALSLAAQLVNAGESSRAVDVLESHMRATGPHMDGMALLALAHLRAGDHARAEAIYGQLRTQPIGSPQTQQLVQQLAAELDGAGADGG